MQFSLGEIQSDGSPLRDHVEVAVKANSPAVQPGGEWAEFANPPPLLREAAYVWDAFLDLDRGRGSSGFGPNPIGFQDIHTWSLLTRTRVEPWEIKAILSIDAEYLKSAAKAAEKQGK